MFASPVREREMDDRVKSRIFEVVDEKSKKR